jgi:hypothetical protein
VPALAKSYATDSSAIRFRVETRSWKSFRRPWTWGPPHDYTLELEDLTVGRRAERRDLTATVVARGRKSLTIEINKDGEQVYYIRLLGGDGQPLAFTGPNVTTASGGAWRFELSPLGQPARAEVIFARNLERKVYPIALTLK